ncbi:autotransporter domain-containing protein [Bradyrhizobium sp. CCBAU 53340]|uniref:autotransporter outer membrane beta-barrel domain-containing protein n=1 Tax=Bradyrhizobium sp. CCBAU 53340 TaxID=1325112 RepID=UPI00188BE284|nr:autotransporter outer membrane beta-barrel domain-containing protein [Bradyrhizobium sp. CCBAU 53340]
MSWHANEARAQACVGSPVQTNQTCSNSTTLINTSTFLGNPIGLQDSATLTLTNTATGTISGVVAGSATGVGAFAAQDANVTNAGTISGSAPSAGGYGIDAYRDSNVTNSGTITGTGAYAGIGIAGTNANVTNTGTISGTAGTRGYGLGVTANRDANVTNSGTISGTGGPGGYGVGIYAVSHNANVTNSGSVTGTAANGLGLGIWANTANVTNSGTISGSVVGIYATTANVANSGTISGGSVGITTSTANATNAGTISGGQVGIYAYNASVTNSGIISGPIALQLTGNADTLTLLPGSRIIGAIYLGAGGAAAGLGERSHSIALGSGNTVNFGGGNQNLTFNTLAGATVTGTAPFAASGNQAAAIDPTSFAANWRSLADFTRGVSDAVPVFSGGTSGGTPPLAFAGPDAPTRFDDVFAAIPGLASAYASEAAVFKAPTAAYADGTTVWARGFVGQRIQQQDGVLLRTANLFYGGMIGADFAARPDLRTGLFLGGGKTRTGIDLNQGSTDSDLLFGGAYARYDIGASFLHGAIQGGSSRNSATRTINNNLVAGGIETASASFNGWYVSPELTFGHRFALGQLADATYTLTPSARLRYLYGAFEGYTETGTTAPLTVGEQTASTVEERGEVKLTRSVAFGPTSQLSTSLSGGVLGTQRVGSSTVNAALLGQAIPFATPGQANVWGGFGGLGLEWRSRNVSLFAAAEYLALSDSSNVVSGRAGVRVGF